MTSCMIQFKGFLRAVRLGLAALLLLCPGAALASDSSDYAVVDGILIYYSVIPAEMIRAYPKGSAESRMHGGVPNGHHMHHIQVALFDAASNERIIDAKVTASVSEPGFATTTNELEPFTVQGALTYGNYFKFSNLVTYTVDIKVARPGTDAIVSERFEFRHN